MVISRFAIGGGCGSRKAVCDEGGLITDAGDSAPKTYRIFEIQQVTFPAKGN